MPDDEKGAGLVLPESEPPSPNEAIRQLTCAVTVLAEHVSQLVKEQKEYAQKLDVIRQMLW